MGDAEDRACVRRVLGGDPTAFEPIVRRWQKPLLNLAYRYCRDRGRAEELVQEAFLRAYRKLSMYREKAAFSTWLFTVASRLFTSDVRKYTPTWADPDKLSQLPSWTRTIEEFEAREDAEGVRAAVVRLPDKYRDTVALFYFLDQDIAEVARVLGVAPGTVKARLHRGREMLRRNLTGRIEIRPAAKEA